MPLGKFIDQNGVTWDVWVVHWERAGREELDAYARMATPVSK